MALIPTKWWTTNAALPLLFVFCLASGRANALPCAVAATAVQTDTLTAAPDKAEGFRGWVRHKLWPALLPHYVVVQYAGSIGFLSAGIGWQYGHRHWETEALIGFVPQYETTRIRVTTTVKQRYIPWNLALKTKAGKEKFSFRLEPLTLGGYINAIQKGGRYWKHEPSYYGGGYYGYCPQLRMGLYAGQRLQVLLPDRLRGWGESLSLYYELGVSDLDIISAIPNRRISFGDILSLAIGVKWQLY